jgi:DNA-binding CsgD family transcriptional regulator
MNPVAEEMNDILMHYGIKRRSGRYPWGSGEDPYQHDRDFLGRIEELKKSGWSETPENIRDEFGLTTTQYRAQKALAKDERRALNVATAKSLKEDGLGETEIGRRMGVNESTVRSWLNAESEARMNQAKKTADFIKEQIAKKGTIDVGTGVERELGISKEKMNQALALLEAEGYLVQSGRVEQATNKGQWTTIKAISAPGTDPKDFYKFTKGEANIASLNEYVSHDGGETFDKFVYPKSMDSNRLMIRYKEDGGIDKDGIVEIRRGVADLSLGNSHYAQVRILVDGNKYIKGMAVYSDDMPDGVDVVFNTNKSKSIPKMEVLKNIKDDPENPFGSLIKAGGQSYYIDKDGNRQLSLINKRADEGDWTDWKDALPSQFLSKQPLQLAKKQLGLAAADKMDEYNEICSLTNPTVKKYLLNKFADECDSAAVHLQAAALPGQKYHVIIPVNSLKDTEVYAPNYENGTKLALVRYPHGGTFEIPILTVNNKNPAARKLLGSDVSDAIGITAKVAERLSGADFDGDTVMCIPTHDKGGKVKIQSTPPLKGLEGFDPKTAYGPDTYKGRAIKTMKNTGTQMGIISNLITDMTLQGADDDELARAVRHSMVVIDAEKHKLDYKKSEIDNGISALKKKYQTGGASTLLSRSKGQTSVLKRQGSPLVNMKGKEWYDPNKPEGSLIYKTADDASYSVRKVNKKTGEVETVTKYRMQKSTKMAETDDAYSLVSKANTPMERAYADYANKMKSLANQARKEMMNTGKIAYSSTAKATYQQEVSSLMSKLNTALLNAPRERQAQLKANAEINAKKLNNPNMKAGDIKKASQQALTKYRNQVGSVARSKRSIKITDKEWEAIQAGAISENYLKKILNNTDIETLRERATPRATTTLSQTKINRIKSLSASNYTLSEIAQKLGISTTTVSNYLKS